MSLENTHLESAQMYNRVLTFSILILLLIKVFLVWSYLDVSSKYIRVLELITNKVLIREYSKGSIKEGSTKRRQMILFCVNLEDWSSSFIEAWDNYVAKWNDANLGKRAMPRENLSQIWHKYGPNGIPFSEEVIVPYRDLLNSINKTKGLEGSTLNQNLILQQINCEPLTSGIVVLMIRNRTKR